VDIERLEVDLESSGVDLESRGMDFERLGVDLDFLSVRPFRFNATAHLESHKRFASTQHKFFLKTR
jgi:hypothetical protein